MAKEKEGREAISSVRFYPEDWLAGTSELTAEQRGVYITICALIWAKQGRVPDNDRWLAGQCGMSTRKWKTVKNALIAAGKMQVVDLFLFNNRAFIELENALKMKDKAIEKGRKGGRKKAELERKGLIRNDRTHSPASARATSTGSAPALAILNLNQKETCTSESKSRARAREATAGDSGPKTSTWAGMTLVQIGDKCLDCARMDARTYLRPYKQVHRWLLAGADPEMDIFQVIEAIAATPTYEPPGTLDYFTPAVMRGLKEKANTWKADSNGAVTPKPWAAPPQFSLQVDAAKWDWWGDLVFHHRTGNWLPGHGEPPPPWNAPAGTPWPRGCDVPRDVWEAFRARVRANAVAGIGMEESNGAADAANEADGQEPADHE